MAFSFYILSQDTLRLSAFFALKSPNTRLPYAKQRPHSSVSPIHIWLGSANLYSIAHLPPAVKILHKNSQSVRKFTLSPAPFTYAVPLRHAKLSHLHRSRSASLPIAVHIAIPMPQHPVSPPLSCITVLRSHTPVDFSLCL